jgi:hypothetical protein
MSYLGNSPTDQSFVATVDYFNGDGVTVAFTLSRQVASVAQVQAVIENVPQNPSSAFTLMGNVITFTSAPPSGSANIYVYYTSPNTQVIAPSAGTVDRTALAAAAVTPVKMANYGAELGMRNRIINGDMRIDQRNAGASVTPINGSYTLDRWKVRYSANTCTVQRSTVSPVGFNNSLQLTVGTARTVVSGDRFGIEQPIEGFNSSDFGWGTTNAQTITLSFWVRSSLTGTFGLCFSNFSRGYAATYTINAANTWEYKTVNIVGDTSGAWDTNSSTGVIVVFDIGMGSDVRTTTGSWQAGTFLGATGATNLVSTSGATFYITGVQLEKGTLATPFEYRPYGTELALCQRYFCQFGGQAAFEPFGLGVGESSTIVSAQMSLPVPMRIAPTGLTAISPTSLSGTFGTPTGAVFDTAGYTIAMVRFTYASGVTTGGAARMYAGNSLAPRIQFSTEL